LQYYRGKAIKTTTTGRSGSFSFGKLTLPRGRVIQATVAARKITGGVCVAARSFSLRAN
jgi:hypothetical protein